MEKAIQLYKESLSKSYTTPLILPRHFPTEEELKDIVESGEKIIKEQKEKNDLLMQAADLGHATAKVELSMRFFELYAYEKTYGDKTIADTYHEKTLHYACLSLYHPVEHRAPTEIAESKRDAAAFSYRSKESSKYLTTLYSDTRPILDIHIGRKDLGTKLGFLASQLIFLLFCCTDTYKFMQTLVIAWRYDEHISELAFNTPESLTPHISLMHKEVPEDTFNSYMHNLFTHLLVTDEERLKLSNTLKEQFSKPHKQYTDEIRNVLPAFKFTLFPEIVSSYITGADQVVSVLDEITANIEEDMKASPSTGPRP
jgi:hypothetical protein